MSAFHKRSPEQYAELRAKILRVWNSDPDISAGAIVERFGVSHGFLQRVLVEAYEKGETARSTQRPASTRASRTGRL